MIDDEKISAITKATQDYGEGWYDGDAARMERALHPGLCKQTVVRDGGSADSLTLGPVSTARFLTAATAEGGGQLYGDGPAQAEIEVLSVFRDMAMVRCRSRDYVDFLILLHTGSGKWQVSHALWQYHEGYENAGKLAKEQAETA